MGTKILSAFNLQITLPKSIKTSDSWDFFNKSFPKEKTRITDPNTPRESMDRMLEQYHRESFKKTILVQEEIFKEQVKELHRLYNLQKMLMAELKNKESKLHELADPTPRAIPVGPTNLVYMNGCPGSWNLATSETNSVYNFHQLHSIRVDQSLQEQSSSCSGYTFRMHRGFDLERPAGEDITTDFSIIEDQVGRSSGRSLKDKMSIDGYHDTQLCTDRENEVELTLSIGFGTSKKKLKNLQPNRSLKFGCAELTHNETRHPGPSSSIGTNGGDICSELINTVGSGGETFDHESLPRPAWLFHSLSLNRT